MSVGALLFLAALPGSDGHDDGRLDFSRDVRPILSRNCFPCHGPDSAARQADLRLDRREVLDDPRGIVVPGELEASALVARLRSTDPDFVMPPPDARNRPGADEVEALLRWVREGAPYEDHWSFLPLATASPSGTTGWARNEVDRFVEEALRERGLTPSPEADRRTLIRRVTLDLTGMPATPGEVASFLADASGDAYERVVDRLLASKAYAERMTLAWMDAARYGDTSVFHADGPRDMWPWRDWVIDAYDRNMPFDRFTLEQLAGDLLPDATREQRIATGFLRNNGTSDEGGAIDEELRVGYMVDRVKTTGNVFLGLSMECAQCHEHKYDPISQEDYYRFYAYFNQSVEPGFQTREGNQAPVVAVPRPEQLAEEARLTAELADLERELDAEAAVARSSAEFASWTRAQRGELLALEDPTLGKWSSIGPFRATSSKLAYDTRWGPEEVARGAIDTSAAVGELSWTARPEWVDGRVHAFPPADNAATYLFRTLEVRDAARRVVSLGSDDTLRVWLNGDEVLAAEVYRGAAPDQDLLALDLAPGVNHLLLQVVNGGGPSGFYFRLLGLALPDEVLGALAVEADARSEEQTGALAAHYARAIAPAGTEKLARVQALQTALDELDAAIPTVMGMEDRPEGRPTYVLRRGQYDAPDETRPVQPGVLEFLLPPRAEAPANRLGLAEWLVDPDHPLTSRVAVNRTWAMLFGTGLVETVMDFGSQGSWPSHPELLDWLARDFVASGWDVKRLLRQVVTSATYRQSSRSRADVAAVDPANRLLARAPRFRLQGEFLRDQALSVAGLLVDRAGGPGVRPYQPAGLWNEVSLDKNVRFTQGTGEELYRKSMYIYWKRSAPMPAMTTLDAPSRETCVVQRQRTNTPLQALVTLNDVQFVEASRHLAQRMLAAGDDFETRLDRGFELCTARPADALRREVCEEVLARELERFRSDPARASELLAVGDSPTAGEHDPAEHAAWTVLASMLLNLDETLNRD